MPGDSTTTTASQIELRGRSFVAGKEASGKGAIFHGISPADGKDLPPAYYSATSEELNAACRLAAEVFPAYSRTTGEQRASFLRTIASNIEAIGEQLTSRMVEESGLPMGRAQSELGRTSGQLRMFADRIEEGSWVNARIDPALLDRKPLPRPDLRSMLRPLGPVAIFAASNFPLAFSVAGGDTASALAAGCPVVVKAHSSHPGTSELVGAVIRNAVRGQGLPDGVFSMLFDAGFEIGTGLVQHPEIKAVAFTGSRSGGLALLKAANQRPDPIPFYAEMSSVNPVFVLPGAMRDRGEEIAKGIHASITLGAGQFCTKPGIVMLADDERAREFSAKVGELVSASQPFRLLNRGIQSAYQKGSAERLQSERLRSIAQTQAAEEAGFNVAPVAFETTVDDLLADRSLSDELFGPSTLLVKYETREQMLAMANALEGHLTATIHGTPEDLAEYRDLVEILERKVGRLVFNGYSTGVEVSDAIVHGGPFPATSDSRTTSVGSMAIFRFARPVCFQGFPQETLPPELQDANPLGIWRMIDGKLTHGAM